MYYKLVLDLYLKLIKNAPIQSEKRLSKVLECSNSVAEIVNAKERRNRCLEKAISWFKHSLVGSTVLCVCLPPVSFKQLYPKAVLGEYRRRQLMY